MYPQSLPPFLMPFIAFIIVWEVIWKLFALWKSARNGEKIWFVCILVINTVGVLPIVYLLLQKEKEKQAKKQEKNTNLAE
jgi:Family of unknown function (DUF5652)